MAHWRTLRKRHWREAVTTAGLTHAARGAHNGRMTEMPQAGVIPEWTLGWRMQRALAHAEISVEAIAGELGVSRSSVSRWLNDRGAPPRAAYLKLWALRTGVPYEWLTGPDFRRGFRTAPFLTLVTCAAPVFAA